MCNKGYTIRHTNPYDLNSVSKIDKKFQRTPRYYRENMYVIDMDQAKQKTENNFQLVLPDEK
jgi:hypothetical protein